MSIVVDSPAKRKSQRSSIPPRPKALPVNADGIPQKLRARQQWVVWRYTWKRQERKWDKPPWQVNGQPAKANDPTTWTDFDTAYRAYRRGGFDGIGFVPTADDPFVFLDLDHVMGPNGLGEWSPELQAMFVSDVPSPSTVVAQLDTYVETSPSGTGVRIVCGGKLPEGRRKIGGKGNGCPDGVELYSQAHYLTLTGQKLPGVPSAINERTVALATLHAAVFGSPTPKPASVASDHAHAVATELGDVELVEKASQSKGGARFHQLWTGDASAYPSRSEADFALASRLAFWCGPDAGRIERLMLQSGLARPKWDRHGGYLALTIANALKDRTEFYSPDRKGIPCGYLADCCSCPDSCVQCERVVRTNRDKATIPQYIRKQSARYSTNPWDCPGAFGVAGQIRHSPALIPAVCRKRDCPVCGPRWSQVTFERFGYHIDQHAGPLFTDCIPDVDWQATLKAMRRESKASGTPLTFVAIRDEEGMLTVISSVAPSPYATPIDKTAAVETLQRAVDAADPAPRPFSACRAWGKIDTDPESEDKAQRVPGGASPAAFAATLGAWGAEAVTDRGAVHRCSVDNLFLDPSTGQTDGVARADFGARRNCTRLAAQTRLLNFENEQRSGGDRDVTVNGTAKTGAVYAAGQAAGATINYNEGLAAGHRANTWIK